VQYGTTLNSYLSTSTPRHYTIIIIIPLPNRVVSLSVVIGSVGW
jgi:hypothetical protein